MEGDDDGVDVHERGPVHEDPGVARWHRGNVGEVLPGVSTPLNADFWRPSMESGLLGTFHRLGLADARERGGRDGAASPYAGRICRFFYGRLASDFDIVLDLFARMPGVDPRLLEQQFLGESSGAARPRPSAGRAAVAVTKSAQALLSLPILVPRRTRTTHQWWQAATTDVTDKNARPRFVDAQTRLQDDLELQITVAMLQAALVDRLGVIVRRAMGDEELLPALVAGIAGIEEGHMMDALWRVARRGEPMATFLARYGYYGPDEGELSTRSWREDPESLERVLDAYRSMPEADSPAERLRARAAEARSARTRVLRAADVRDGAAFRSLWPLARRYTGLREEGKTLMLRRVDGGRAAARAVGAALAAEGTIAAADDVFFLTQAELATDLHDARETVAARRRRHHAYQELVLPLTFRGSELARVVEAAPRPLATGGDAIEGLGVSPGIADGTARVVVDPLECDTFEPGEILVCVTTDPGWSPLLSVAAGVVLDAGSMLSHGAIVARELGVPCVANTVDATRRIADGVRVRVDGIIGVVTILDGHPEAATGSAA